MKLPFYSLRTAILAQLIFLIVAAMILVDVVMVKFSEKDFVQSKIQTGRTVIRAVEQHLGYLPILSKGVLTEVDIGTKFSRDVAQLLATGGFTEAVIINQRGVPVFRRKSSFGDRHGGIPPAREAMNLGDWSTELSGATWGVIWISSERLRISAPLVAGGRTLGGISISTSLQPLYQDLRKTQKIILLYILLDTIILAIVGIYLLSRIVVRPIHKLLRLTADYKEGDLIPTPAQSSRDEIGELTRSLNVMLGRLQENKKELKGHITSLEKANQELGQAQDELIRSEKLASVGRLAAGIAHEIGNPIGIVLGYLELLQRDDIGEEERADFLNRIEKEITRINVIIRQLLDFSRPSTGKPEQTHVHEILRRTVEILKPQPMMEDIQVLFQLEATTDAIHADPQQLQQVFLNIIMNAGDAHAEDAQGQAVMKKRSIRIETMESDDTIVLRFVDNGPGIPSEELIHIFDPFYTTKDPGRGTGLGLSVSYRLVEALGGTLQAESVIGEGTTFIIRLPLHRDGEE
ncbi:MAG: HAMP domain-containing protein [Deltaproteobacteria bacterium]|nr:HAMP domain-containing protein [Deltaproteobacteria bacterium]